MTIVYDGRPRKTGKDGKIWYGGMRPDAAVFVQGIRGGTWWRQGLTTGAAARDAFVAVCASGAHWHATRWGDAPAESDRNEAMHRTARVLVLEAEEAGRPAPHRLSNTAARAAALRQGRRYPYAVATGYREVNARTMAGPDAPLPPEQQQ